MEPERLAAGLFGILGGAFSVWAAVTEQSWFFNSRKARNFAKVFGHNGAKIFYILIGAFLIVIGFAALFLK